MKEVVIGGFMRIFGCVLGLVLAGSLASCASAERIHSLHSGMSSSQVSDEVGDPETIRRQGEQVVWFYRTDEGRCAVVFEAEHVSSWACSGDEPGEASLKAGTETASAAIAVSAASAPPPVFMH